MLLLESSILDKDKLSVWLALSLIAKSVSLSNPQNDKIIYSLYTHPKRDIIMHKISDKKKE